MLPEEAYHQGLNRDHDSVMKFKLRHASKLSSTTLTDKLQLRQMQLRQTQAILQR